MESWQFRRVKESDMIKLAKATGGRVISNLDDLTEQDLGVADLAQQKKVESDKWVFIEGCKHPQSVTMLIRGGSQRVIDEVDRSIHDSLMVVKDVIEKPEIVAGGVHQKHLQLHNSKIGQIILMEENNWQLKNTLKH